MFTQIFFPSEIFFKENTEYVIYMKNLHVEYHYY